MAVSTVFMYNLIYSPLYLYFLVFILYCALYLNATAVYFTFIFIFTLPSLFGCILYSSVFYFVSYIMFWNSFVIVVPYWHVLYPVGYNPFESDERRINWNSNIIFRVMCFMFNFILSFARTGWHHNLYPKKALELGKVVKLSFGGG